ncbi:MAG: HU family DNA-binding protein [Candidatus ainarchaeum sp.]|jgi:DNA-binding protein HU-beta|nr:HU family DNA-binding protein [Candidatus ainarchaeum sp.]NCP72235.1 HU family DNA-binding protein [archaeon]NCP79410.1 HU family DNA-binding protein [archaeon]NCP97353.1 HU family DNA-binding protein [archaeon]NCQ07177.1 HU family DNA-binding protein [archaeon]
MNKSTLIEAVVKKTDLSKAKAEEFINTTLEAMKVIVKKEGKLQLVGFGTFKVKKRAARMGRNPQTGKSMKIAASKTVSFKVGKEFKERL